MKILSVNNYQTQNQNVTNYSDQKASFNNYSNPKAKLNNNIAFTSTPHIPVKKNVGDKFVGALHGAFLAAEKDFFVQKVQTPNEIPATLKNIIEPVTIKAVDGADIVCWQSQVINKDAPTILYLHGNQNQLTSDLTVQMIELANKHGLNVFAPEYRGFAKQQFKDPTAVVTRDSLLADSTATAEHMEDLGISTEDAIAGGHSLGGCNVLNLPGYSKKKFKSVFVNSGFPDSPKLSQYVSGQQFPFLKFLTDKAHPESFTLNQELAWDNLKALNYLKENGIETVILQAKDDLAQPYYLAKLLDERAKEIGFDQFRFIAVPNGGHDNLTPEKIKAISDFFIQHGGVKIN